MLKFMQYLCGYAETRPILQAIPGNLTDPMTGVKYDLSRVEHAFEIVHGRCMARVRVQLVVVAEFPSGAEVKIDVAFLSHSMENLRDTSLHGGDPINRRTQVN